jgi:hypothetical protein
VASARESKALHHQFQEREREAQQREKEMAAPPIDLVLVRHGESEGNIAQEMSKLNDDTLWDKQGFKERHTSKYRHTPTPPPHTRSATAPTHLVSHQISVFIFIFIFIFILVFWCFC